MIEQIFSLFQTPESSLSFRLSELVAITFISMAVNKVTEILVCFSIISWAGSYHTNTAFATALGSGRSE